MTSLIERLNIATSGDNAPLRSTRVCDADADFQSVLKHHCYENEAMDNLPAAIVEPLSDLIENHLIDNGVAWFWFDVQ